MNPVPPQSAAASSSAVIRELRPRLLVSVQTATEAAEALRAGIDLLDVKDPARGSLGQPDPAQLQAVLDTRDRIARATPVSVALGEFSDWTDASSLESASVLSRVAYAKLGLADMAGRRDWRLQWERLRNQIEVNANEAPGWVAVIYADWAIAGSPAPDEIVAAAAETGCAGVLIDTFCKHRGRLLEHFSPADLCLLSVQVRDAGMFFAVAGQLQSGDLPQLAQVPLDVIAVRSAVCEGGNRQSRFSLSRMESFREAMRRAFAGVGAHDVSGDHHIHSSHGVVSAE